LSEKFSAESKFRKIDPWTLKLLDDGFAEKNQRRSSGANVTIITFRDFTFSAKKLTILHFSAKKMVILHFSAKKLAILHFSVKKIGDFTCFGEKIGDITFFVQQNGDEFENQC
jgi:hypothetical protein